jgi:pimeloyl-ACP methyl ester carboxylesterase/DNA-directed RNA polymerase subunit RPC12/RpoP
VRRSLPLLTAIALSCTTAAPTGLPYHESEVRFPSGDAEIAATIYIPTSRPPYPGVVFIHGSGSSDRRNAFAGGIARALAGRGVAVLLPDKRGSGQSTGDWKTVGLDVLAADSAAAAAVLQRQRGVKRGAVGLVGFSQGAHVAPLAATLEPGIAFVVAVSGSVVPIIEQTRDEVMMATERAGLDEAGQAEIAAIQAAAEHYGMTGSGWADYESKRNAAANREWRGRAVAARFPSRPDDWIWAWARLAGPYDPLPHWRQVRAPVLIVYGEKDTQVRIGRSIAIIRDQLPAGTIKTIKGAGHGLFSDKTSVIRPDVVDAIANWIGAKTRTRVHPPAVEDVAEWTCIPCGRTCDLRVFTRGGACPECGMELLPKHD